MLLAYVTLRYAVLHNMFCCIGWYVAITAVAHNSFMQPFLIAQKGWMVPASQPGQVDFSLHGRERVQMDGKEWGSLSTAWLG